MDNNSELFEKRYKQVRGQGKPGWSTEESYANHKNNIDRIIAAGYVKDKGRVLELGSGAGNNTIYLAKKGYEVYGIDFSKEAVGWAEEKAVKEKVKASFILGDVALLKELKDSCFDFVFDGGVSYYVCGARRDRFFKNVNRVLKPGGFFFLYAQHSDEKPGNEVVKGRYRWDPLERTLYMDGKEWGSYKFSKDILEEVKQGGFKVLKAKIGKDEHPEDPFQQGGELFIDCVKE